MASNDAVCPKKNACAQDQGATKSPLFTPEQEKEFEEILQDPRFEDGCRPLFDRLAKLYKLPYSDVAKPKFWMLDTQLKAVGQLFSGISKDDAKDAGNPTRKSTCEKAPQPVEPEPECLIVKNQNMNDEKRQGEDFPQLSSSRAPLEAAGRARGSFGQREPFADDSHERRIFGNDQSFSAGRDSQASGENLFESASADASDLEQDIGLQGASAPQGRTPLWLRARRAAQVFARVLKNRRERGELGKVTDQKAEKTKQRRNLLLLLCAIVLFSLVVAYVSEKNAQPRTPVIKTYRNDFRLEPDSLDKQSFQRQYEEKLDDIGIKMKSMEALMGQLDARMKALAKQEQAKAGAVAKSAEADGAVRVPLSDLAPRQMSDDEALREDQARLLSSISVAGSGDSASGRMGIVKVAGQKKAESTQRGPRRIADLPIAANRARHERENTYLPAGSFAHAVILSGVTAPTGGNAAQNPMPLLMEIKRFAQLPNDFKANIKRCFVTANATGDLSSERVLVRLDRLACMNKHGKAVDVRVQGYVTGEDGKAGARARLVTRSGQAIASALFTGAISGLGKAVSLSAQSTTTYTSGAVGSSVENAWAAGIGEGVDDAMDRIVNYYLKLADKIFPVLELDSGRKVDIVLSQGLAISFDDPDPKEPEIVNHSQVFGDRQRSLREGYAALESR